MDLVSQTSPAATPESTRQRALDKVLNHIDRSFGQGSIMRLGAKQSLQVETIPTGIFSLDIALGGGLPKGRIVEIFGPESSGKTTLALHAIAAVQAAGGTAAFIDVEHALDPVYAEAIGIDPNQLLVAQPNSGETALEITDQLARSGAISIVVVDSVAALVPRAEIESEIGDIHLGSQARLMSQALRKITGRPSKSNCTIIFLNQLRQKLDVACGHTETTTGGVALKFYASVRLDIRRVQVLKKGIDSAGICVRVQTVKNKIAPPFRSVELDILSGNGISKLSSLFDAALSLGVIERWGACYVYQGQTIARYRESAIEYLEQQPRLAVEIEYQLRTSEALALKRSI